MSSPDFNFNPANLSHGDTKSLDFDTSGIEIIHIRSADHPLFRIAYERLWKEFGPLTEIEERDVLLRRFRWAGGKQMLYEMIVVAKYGEIAAIRDHTAILAGTTEAPSIVVHLSHVLVEPVYRRSGLAGWMRAFPVETAREVLASNGLPASSPVTLVAEMEPPGNLDYESRFIRLAAYERAGFKKVDSAMVHYFQPDFRSVAEIESTGVHLLPFVLVMRRVEREAETTIGGRELRETVAALYKMYAASLRDSDVEPLIQSLADYPSDDKQIRLLAPTA